MECTKISQAKNRKERHRERHSLGRPAKKRCRAEAKATRLGQLQAEYEFKKAHSITKKPEDFLEEQGKKLLDKLDPLETVAIVGMTVLVHGVIISSKPLMEKKSLNQEVYIIGMAVCALGVIRCPHSPDGNGHACGLLSPAY